MRVINYPNADQRAALLKRPVFERGQIQGDVSVIINCVKSGGDRSLVELTRELDGVKLDRLEVTNEEFEFANDSVPQDLKDAIAVASRNIEKFHDAEDRTGYRVEVMPGVSCWKKWLPIERVGIYVPAGSAPLFSTVLMLAIPARLAGCSEIVLCSPPGRDGSIDATTLFAAGSCGITRAFKIGGAQAVAAMAFGTESVPRVDKIFGPGNQFVTEAKMQVMGTGVAIDMPAGPSEVAVLADDTAIPAFVAADLLSQAEHGPDSQVLLVSTSGDVVEKTLSELEKQLNVLPRREFARRSLANSSAIIVSTLEDGIEFLNEYAPEHLILACRRTDELAEKVRNAGSVFLGNFSCESAGDYAAGTNHTLPTNGAARGYSGLSVLSFMKSVTFQRLTNKGIRSLGPVIETMAAAEGLEAHKYAVSVRLQSAGEN